MKPVAGKRFILICSLTTLSLVLAFGQPADQILSKRVGEHNLRNYREELRMTTDRDIYVTGEQVWVSLQRLNALSHSPENISKVIYLELLDKNNASVRQVKTSVNGNAGSAVFTLPDNISSGSYLLRAYTLWMQNFPAGYFSYKTISVVNPFESVEHIPVLSARKTADSLIAWPEGGALLPGRSCRVAIRAFEKNGIPVAANAAIVRNSSDTVYRTTTNENGWGLAEFRVNRNDSYVLVCKGQLGRIKTLLLSQDDQAWGLRTDLPGEGGNLMLRILKGGTLNQVNLLIVSEGTVVRSVPVNCIGDTTLTISKDVLPSGLNLVIVTDPQGLPLAGRYLFIARPDRLRLALTLSKDAFLPRDKVSLRISVTDNAGQPVAADLSISVVKKALADSKRGPVLTGLSLRDNEMIAGLPEKEINDYLAGVPADYSELKSILGQDKSEFRYMPELEGHRLMGSIKIKDTGEPLRNTDISLSYVGKTANCQFGRTNEKGEFSFLVTENGINEIVIQPVSPEITGCYTEIDQPFSDSYSRFAYQPFRPDTGSLNGLNNAIISAQIANIYETTTITRGSDRTAVSHDFYGKAETTIKMADYIELTTLREVVKEILPNVYTVKQGGKYDFRLINKFRGQPFTNTPLILVDGVPIYDFEKVLNISSKEIDKADIINTRYFYSRVVFDGIVSFVSKKGDLGSLEFDNSVFRQIYEGCQSPAGFRSPDYTDVKQKDGRTPDFRNTLYWNPSLSSGNDGRSAAEFFTSDETAAYVIRVEGITPDGSTGEATIPLVVRQR